jgi:hypothetical protein
MMRLVLITIILLAATIARGQTEKNRLFVFVGEKISVTPFDPKVPEGTIIMDNAFQARYKVIQSVFGAYDNDTIEFEVYDHYGEPPFSKFAFALLYVSRRKDGKLYHEKYMYSDVYRTVDGRWAGPYESQDYNHDFNKNTTVKPEPILFKEPVSFDITQLDKEIIQEYYPEPYFKIRDGRAYVEMGNYIEDLFKLKRDGFLKARGLF